MSAVDADTATMLRWQRLRALFDAVADRPPDQWAATLARMGVASEERDEALELLRAQTMDLGQVRVSISGLASRLADERQILADLRGDGIARLYDAGVSETGQHYLVMEHVEGRTLDACVDTLGFEARLRMFVRICRIVQTAYPQSVVHCDLKPGNVLIDGEGAPVLLDFGVARLLGVDTGAPAEACFIPAYASPELVAGRAPDLAKHAGRSQ